MTNFLNDILEVYVLIDLDSGMYNLFVWLLINELEECDCARVLKWFLTVVVVMFVKLPYLIS